MTTITQSGRMLQFHSSLGAHKLLLESFAGVEAMSELFHFHLELFSEDAAISATQLVGQPACVEVSVKDSPSRYFHGRVARFVAAGLDQRGLRGYRAELVAWPWLMTHRHGCRIFQNVSALDIAQKLFAELGFADFEIRVDNKPPPLEYCVQYRESDWSFISRLLEEFGIFYFFRHEKSRHVLVLGDSKAAWDDCAESEPRFVGGSLQHSHVTRWEHGWEFVSGAAAHSDYNYLTATKKLYKETKTVVPLGETKKFETYDYPGRFPDDGQGDSRVRVRMEEQEIAWDVADGDSTCKSFSVGSKFKLVEHDVSSEKGKSFVLISVAHSATDRTHRNSSDASHSYTNAFRCIPAATPYRPPRRTPRPRVHGPQTAVVVGPAGEEIYTDPDGHGRIKVQFHWDREGKKDQNSSCWIRVAQTWAGKGWGAQFLPRIGQEVVVEFLEGDPDRPLVTGSVYNSFQTPPFAVPANKTQAGVRTRSTLGGGTSNCNEVRFEDKKGSEQLFIQAEKDKVVNVKNDRTETVGHDETITIVNNRTEKVGVDETIAIGSNRTETVGADETITIGKNRSESVGSSETVTIAMTRTHSIGINDALDVGAAQEISVGAIQAVSVGAERKTSVGLDDSLSVGKKLSIEAGEQITLKTGAASITMKKDGTIVIKGKDISIEGSGKVEVKASSDVTIKGSKIAQN